MTLAEYILTRPEFATVRKFLEALVRLVTRVVQDVTSPPVPRQLRLF